MTERRGFVGLKFGVLALALAWSSHAFAASADDYYVYKVVKGDTLIGLTTRLLRSSTDWPEVARYNRLRNPHAIEPGMELRVPLALLNHTLAPVIVTQMQGDVKVASRAGAGPSVAASGASLSEGAKVVTGKDGYATLRLQDGSTVRVQPGTELQVERQRTYPDVGILESVMTVISGRVTSLVQKFRAEENKQTRHGVNTPLANLAVRGTEFRVTMDPQTNNTRGEVLSGAVAVGADGAATGAKRLDAGFGSVVDSNKSVSDPIALLAPPDVTQLATLQERILLRFPLSAIEGARAYRAQLARDEAFNAVVAELLSPSPELRVADIADGNYFLRVRSVDANGLEGRDATHAFTLKARPEPPLAALPLSKGKVSGAEVTFKWIENAEAAAYHLQVAKDPAFRSLVQDDRAVKGAQSVLSQLPEGKYFWRVASLRKNGDHGPFGDANEFLVLTPPAAPTLPAIGDGDINIRWAGEPGQTFDFQMDNNPAFKKPIVSQRLQSPEVNLPRPIKGAYYVRYRAIDADGFVGPYSPTQRITVTEPPWPSPYPVPSLPLYGTP
jgi:hypothetical protein